MGNVITGSELIERLANKCSVSEADAQACIGAFTSSLRDELALNGRVELRGFGVFTYKHYTRVARNPRTGTDLGEVSVYSLRLRPTCRGVVVHNAR